VNPYEIMLLLDAELAEERQNEILARIKELVETRGGSWQSEDAWGRRKLAFEIEKKGEAFYFLLLFDCDAETLDELTRVLKITDGVLRHMAVRRIPTARTTSQREPSQHHARESREPSPPPARESREPSPPPARETVPAAE
jgi:small subunit ribosomal protein S6